LFTITLDGGACQLVGLLIIRRATDEGLELEDKYTTLRNSKALSKRKILVWDLC